MRTTLAALAYSLSLGLLAFPTYKWGWVVVHNGVREAWDEFTTSSLNMFVTALLLGFSLMLLAAGVLLSQEPHSPRISD